MEKYCATYIQALALRELGFNERTSHYFENGKFKLHPEISGWDFNSSFTTCVSAPLKTQVFEWFRKQGYDTKVEKEREGLYFGFYWTGAAWIIVGNGSYEEAELACIDKLIEIVKNEAKN